MQFLLGQCHAAFQQHPSIFITLALAGLVGGLTHCAGMCGPFVAAQVKEGAKSQTHLQRLSGAALLPYHFGRMTTYMTLGAFAALMSRQIMGTPLQQWASVLFLSLAGLIFVASALPQSKRWLGSLRQNSIGNLGGVIGKIAKPFFAKPTGLGGYGLGVLLGFLPCGLIFAALMVVSTTGSPLTAALAMALFTVGTFPSLFLVGVGGQFAYRRWPNAMQMATRGVMVFNGFSLFILAGNMVL